MSALMLDKKNAVIYGGGGAIGGAIARVFAREGARVFLAGRTQSKLDAVASDIAAVGGAVETARWMSWIHKPLTRTLMPLRLRPGASTLRSTP